MSGTHTTLDAAATDRKARLAKLASLKRKQPGADTTISSPSTPSTLTTDTPQDELQLQLQPNTKTYLSGRNYDPQTQGPKLGFETQPQTNQDTVESQAQQLSLNTTEQAARDEADADEKGIDLFKLRPKKPNWDLKRDLAEKMRVLDVRTQNAIARLVRERIEGTKREAVAKGTDNSKRDDRGEELGLDGSTLVEGVHLREKEEEEEERRERELEEEEAAS